MKQDASLLGVVPRTRVIAVPAPDTKGAQQTQEAFLRLERLRKEVVGKIISLAPKGPLHIWGIGSDFRQMIHISKHLNETIKQENVTLYVEAPAG